LNRPPDELVSVIVPAYNAELTLDETLRSVRAQTHGALEILVVDDGSTDGTAALVARHATEDNRVRLLTQANGGVAAARNHGLGTRAHVCQFTAAKLGPLLQYQPASFDHMDCVQPEDISLLSRGDTVAVLLPGANYFLGHKEFPDARRLIDAGVPVALATDYNPGTSPTPSMPFVISLACTHMKMTPAEAIAASTINAACALRLQERKGK